MNRDDAGRTDVDPGFRVERRIFVGIGSFFVGAAAVYWLLSEEDAGTALLLLAGGLALTCGIYLWSQMRAGVSPSGDGGPTGEPPTDASGRSTGPWFPHASWWPFGVGVGGWLVCNGIILGTWALVPGLMVLAATVVGFVAQTRTR
ncbi:hypothetical protein BH24ACT3_BH24ACT3_05370 [soil metagenome]